MGVMHCLCRIPKQNGTLCVGEGGGIMTILCQYTPLPFVCLLMEIMGDQIARHHLWSLIIMQPADPPAEGVNHLPPLPRLIGNADNAHTWGLRGTSLVKYHLLWTCWKTSLATKMAHRSSLFSPLSIASALKADHYRQRMFANGTPRGRGWRGRE